MYETTRTALTFPENIVIRPPIFGPAKCTSSQYRNQNSTNNHDSANANSDFRTSVHGSARMGLLHKFRPFQHEGLTNYTLIGKFSGREGGLPNAILHQ